MEKPVGNRQSFKLTILLDLMLPKLDGISLCQRLRTSGYGANSDADSTGHLCRQIVGLDTGADDYMVNFDVNELAVRHALLRQGTSGRQPILSWGSGVGSQHLYCHLCL